MILLSAVYHTSEIILFDRLEKSVGVKGTAISWFRSYLTDHYQFVDVNGDSFLHSKVQFGVQHGSVLDPLLFSLSMPLGNIIHKHDMPW